MNKLPEFRYYKNPYIGPDSPIIGIYKSDSICDCCKKENGYIFEHVKGIFCPWCIASGSAAKKFNFSFISQA